MCGRFILTADAKTLAYIFGAELAAKIILRRYNIAPGQQIAVIPNVKPRALEFMKWGLVPHWAKDEKVGYKMINARSETLAVKPSFREPLKKRRCLVLADGFIEWKREEKSKTPMVIRLETGLPFAFAGLWESWKSPDGKELRSCTIITTEANAFMKPIHDRMPVILPESAWDAWLDPEPQDPRSFEPLLKPFSAASLTAKPASKLINSPGNDRPEVLVAEK